MRSFYLKYNNINCGERATELNIDNNSLVASLTPNFKVGKHLCYDASTSGYTLDFYPMLNQRVAHGTVRITDTNNYRCYEDFEFYVNQNNGLWVSEGTYIDLTHSQSCCDEDGNPIWVNQSFNITVAVGDNTWINTIEVEIFDTDYVNIDTKTITVATTGGTFTITLTECYDIINCPIYFNGYDICGNLIAQTTAYLTITQVINESDDNCLLQVKPTQFLVAYDDYKSYNDFTASTLSFNVNAYSENDDKLTVGGTEEPISGKTLFYQSYLLSEWIDEDTFNDLAHTATTKPTSPLIIECKLDECDISKKVYITLQEEYYRDTSISCTPTYLIFGDTEFTFEKKDGKYIFTSKNSNQTFESTSETIEINTILFTISNEGKVLTDKKEQSFSASTENVIDIQGANNDSGHTLCNYEKLYDVTVTSQSRWSIFMTDETISAYRKNDTTLGLKLLDFNPTTEKSVVLKNIYGEFCTILFDVVDGLIRPDEIEMYWCKEDGTPCTHEGTDGEDYADTVFTTYYYTHSGFTSDDSKHYNQYPLIFRSANRLNDNSMELRYGKWYYTTSNNVNYTISQCTKTVLINGTTYVFYDSANLISNENENELIPYSDVTVNAEIKAEKIEGTENDYSVTIDETEYIFTPNSKFINDNTKQEYGVSSITGNKYSVILNEKNYIYTFDSTEGKIQLTDMGIVKVMWNDMTNSQFNKAIPSSITSISDIAFNINVFLNYDITFLVSKYSCCLDCFMYNFK